MMSRLWIITILVGGVGFFACMCQAQMAESFEDVSIGQMPPVGWLKWEEAGGRGWSNSWAGRQPYPGWMQGTNTTPPGGGNRMAYVTYTHGGSKTNDLWLITPTLKGITATSTVSFWQNNAFTNFADSLRLWISTNPAAYRKSQFSMLTWKLDMPEGSIPGYVPPGTGDFGAWTKVTVNIGTQVTAGTDIRLGFQEYWYNNWYDVRAIELDLIESDLWSEPTLTTTAVRAYGDVIELDVDIFPGYPAGEMGICWSVGPHPKAMDLDRREWNKSYLTFTNKGVSTCVISNMDAGTKWYLRPYVKHSKGGTYYGNEVVVYPGDSAGEGVLFESFEDTPIGQMPPLGWCKWQEAGGRGWSNSWAGRQPMPGWMQGTNSTPPGGGERMAYVTYTHGGSKTNDLWLITPTIENIPPDCTLKFWQRNSFTNFADNLYAYVSEEPNAYRKSDFTNQMYHLSMPEGAIPGYVPPATGDFGDWTQISIALTNYVEAGTDVRIAFREYYYNNWYDVRAIELDLIEMGNTNVRDGLRFDGVDDYVVLRLTNQPTAFTVEAWVRPLDTRAQTILVRTAGNPYDTYSEMLSMGSSGRFLFYNYDGVARTVSGTTVAQTGVWYHVAGTAQKNGTMRLFVNGVEEGTALSVGSLQTGLTNVYAGVGASGCFKGDIDEVRYWNDVRTATELKDNMSRYLRGMEDGLLACYRLDSTFGHDLFDSTLQADYDSWFGPDVDSYSWTHDASWYDGVEDQLFLPETNRYENYTVEAWVYLEDTSARNIMVYSDDDPLTSYQQQLRIRSGGYVEFYSYDGMIRSVVSPTALNAKQWYHVAGTAKNGSDMKLYINGVEVGYTSAGNTMWGSGYKGYYVGANSALGNYTWFKGRIFNPSHTNRAKGVVELEDEYNAHAEGAFSSTWPTWVDTTTPMGNAKISGTTNSLVIWKASASAASSTGGQGVDLEDDPGSAYLVFGDDGAIGTTRDDIPAGEYASRMNRIWTYDVQGATSLNADITFILSQSGAPDMENAALDGLTSRYFLLYRSVESGAFNTVAAAADSVAAGIVIFSNVAASSGYYTMALRAPNAPVLGMTTNLGVTSFAPTWSASTPVATNYYIDVSTDSGFGSFVSGFQNRLVGNAPASCVVTGLVRGTRYFWRVRAEYAGGISAYSTTGTVTTYNFAGGTGMESDPFLISELSDLQYLSTNSITWDKYFRQTADIDAPAATNWNGGTGWKPIGTWTAPAFTGTYDGGGHAVRNLRVTSGDFAGMFGYINGGTVKNLGVENVYVAGSRIGALCGWAIDATIMNCYASGMIISPSDYEGGLLGASVGSTVVNCHASCLVWGHYRSGGIIGDSSGNTVLSNCFASGFIRADNASQGGVVGYCEDGVATSTACFYDSQTTAQNSDWAYATGLTTDQFKQQTNFTGWPAGTSEEAPWVMHPRERPYLYFEDAVVVNGVATGNVVDGYVVYGCAEMVNATDFAEVGVRYSLTSSMSWSTSVVSGVTSGVYTGLISGLTAGNTYYAQACATDTNGVSFYGDVVHFTAEKKAQTISNFMPTGGVFWVGATVDVSADVPSGLTVSFTNRNVLVQWLSSTQIQFTAGGTMELVASQAGSELYHPAPSLTNVLTVYASNVYANASQADDSGDGLSWGTAKRTLQAAMDICGDGSTLYVTNGMYAAGGRVYGSSLLTNRLAIIRNVAVTSMNGAAYTTIAGAVGSVSNVLGPEAVRGVYMSTGTLSGFTITNGYTLGVDDSNGGIHGGGVLVARGGDVKDCVIRNCGGLANGGGMLLYQGGSATRVLLENNASMYGGGACLDAGSVLSDALIINNHARVEGGGVFTWWVGPQVVNCTISDNEAVGVGDGIFIYQGGALYNSIVYGNASDNIYVNTSSDVQYSCIPGWSGTGCIGDDPLFMGGGNYRLQPDSPCIHAGDDPLAQVARFPADLDGHARIMGAKVDMGCYELRLSRLEAVPLLFAFNAVYNGANPVAQTLILTNAGPADLAYTRQTGYGAGGSGWLSPETGGTNLYVGEDIAVLLNVDIAGLNAGTFMATSTFSSVTVSNTLYPVAVTVTVSKADQVIAFANPGAQVTTNVTALTASSTSGLDVNIALLSGPAVLDGNTNLTYTGAGTVVVAATQAGDGNWNPSGVTNSFAVNLTQQQIENFSPTNGSVFAATQVVTLAASASSGLPVTYSLTSGPAVMYGSDTLRFTGAGTVVFSADQAGNAIWEAVSLSHTCTVTDTTLNHYVAQAGQTPYPPYASWVTAASNIQDAVDIAVAGDTVWVSNGLYNAGGRVVGASVLTNRVIITNDITLRSVNGTAYSTIAGAAGSVTNGLGPDAVRGVYMSTGTLTGFTVTNGCTLAADDGQGGLFGGGVLCLGGGTVEDCVMRNCGALGNGGGLYLRFGGSAARVVLENNAAAYGGGACLEADSVLSDALIVNNYARVEGGGVFVWWHGEVRNCTITSNEASASGDGFFAYEGGMARNCIVYGNVSDDVFLKNGGALTNTCSSYAAGSDGNINDDPQFVDAARGNCRLGWASPCIAAGTNVWNAEAVDLDGAPRTEDGLVDMGCYQTPQSAGAALAVDGTNDYIELQGPDDFDMSTDFTLETWLKTTNSGGLFIKTGTSGSWQHGGKMLQIRDGQLELNVFDIGEFIAGPSIVDGRWHHVAAVFDADPRSLDLYVDGAHVTNESPGSWTGELLPASCTLGSTKALLEPWNGQLDEMRFWRVCRTAQELRDGMFRSLGGMDSNLVWYSRANQQGEAALVDMTGHGHCGMLRYVGTVPVTSQWQVSGVPIGSSQMAQNPCIEGYWSSCPDGLAWYTNGLRLDAGSLTGSDHLLLGTELQGGVSTQQLDEVVGARMVRRWQFEYAGEPTVDMTFDLAQADADGLGLLRSDNYKLMQRSTHDGPFAATATALVRNGTAVAMPATALTGAEYTLGATKGNIWLLPDYLCTHSYVDSAGPEPQTCILSNSGGCAFTFTAETGTAWVSISPTSGTLAAESTTIITGTYHIADLETGTYLITNLISSGEARYSPQPLLVELEMRDALEAPVLFAASNITAYAFELGWTNTAYVPTNYWLDVAADNEFSAPVGGYDNRNVGVEQSCQVTGLLPGVTYYARICCAYDGAVSTYSDVQSVTALTEGSLGLNPVPLLLSVGYSQAVSQVVSVTNSGQTGLDFEVSSQYGTNGSGWLVLSPSSGTVDAVSSLSVTAQVNAALLDVGEYHATNQYCSGTATNSPVMQDVVLTVTAADADVAEWPTASAINVGQRLSEATLGGGSANTPGTFAFVTPEYTPGVGTAMQNVMFSPDDTLRFNAVTGQVSLLVYALTVYADAARPDDSGDGLSWTAAKRTLQAAMDICGNGATLYVTNGTYEAGGRVHASSLLTNRLEIIRDVTVRSMNGAEHTVIAGAVGSVNNGLGPDAVRGVFMSTGTLVGFTITNGYTLAVDDGHGGAHGGGILVDCGGDIEDCVIRNSGCLSNGGGLLLYHGGSATRVLLESNRATYGGGACLDAGAVLSDALVINNYASVEGGGVFTWWVGPQVVNCTISDNEAAGVGDGIFIYQGGALYNSIVYGNASDNIYVNTSSDMQYNCSPGMSGSGNIAADPLFVGEGDYRLQPNSPCINLGNNTLAQTNTFPYDMNGNPRILAGTVDMGGYEALLSSLSVSPTNIAFSAAYWSTPSLSQAISFTNTGGNSLYVTNAISYGPGGYGWLLLEPSCGVIDASSASTGMLYVATEGLNAGVYHAVISNVSPTVTGEIDAIQVQLEITKADQVLSSFVPTNNAVALTTNTLYLSADADSGLPVSFTNVSGSVSWLDATSITFTAHGDVAMVASQSGNSNWNPAVSQTNTYIIHGVPSVGDVTLVRMTNQYLKVPVTTLLTNSIDPEGSALKISAVTSLSSNGYTVSRNGNWLLYMPTLTDNRGDAFVFTVTNAFGAGGQGCAWISVAASTNGNEQSRNVVRLTPVGNTIEIRFAGIPGRLYAVECATNLTQPAWTNIGQLTIGPLGWVVYTYTNPPSPSYYRTVRPEEP